jgi:hypothetical protein
METVQIREAKASFSALVAAAEKASPRSSAAMVSPAP